MTEQERQEKIEMLKAKAAYYETWTQTMSQPCATSADADYVATQKVDALGFIVVERNQDNTILLVCKSTSK